MDLTVLSSSFKGICALENETGIERAGTDFRERPRYALRHAARYVGISPTTLRSWVVGRPYPVSGGSGFFRPLIARPVADDSRLSFENLIEAHVLRALRTRHGVPMSAVRAALDYAESEFRIPRLLLRDELRTAAGTLFVERLGHLIDLGRSGQLVMKELLEGHLRRIARGPDGAPLRLFPVIPARGLDGPQIVGIDPQISFGRPFIVGKGVRTMTIVERLDAGESRETVAEDYRLTPSELDEAILYERAA
jgi:uncharacterized protein (DUF433 family)